MIYVNLNPMPLFANLISALRPGLLFGNMIDIVILRPLILGLCISDIIEDAKKLLFVQAVLIDNCQAIN